MNKIWTKNYAPGVPHSIDPDQYASIPDMLAESFKKYANDPCFINFGERLTFKQVDELSQAYAGFLQTECKLEKGDRVAIMMPNTLQYPVALLGALRAGMVNVNISPLYTAKEVQAALQETGAKCILVLANFAHLLQQALDRTQVKYVIVTEIGDLFPLPKRLLFHFVTTYIKKMVPAWFIPNTISFRDTIDSFYQTKFKKTEISGEDLAYLQFTEGRETGAPKCTMITHRNLIANGLQMAVWFGQDENFLKGTSLAIIPFFKLIATSWYILTLTRNGMANNLISNPRETLSLIKEMKRCCPSIIIGIRTIFNDLLFNEEFQKINFSNLKCCISGAMTIPETLAVRWQTITQTIIFPAYVLTEGAPIVTGPSFLIKKFTSSVGLPLPSTNVKICDEQGQELPLGAYGEIWFQGPQVTKGYWNRPEETKKALTEDGWFKSGDIGYMDQKGYIYLIDRKEDIIKTDQGTIYPSEIENIITELGGVEDAVAVGILSKETSKPVVKAYIIKKDESVSEEIILAHCRRRLRYYQVPHVIEFCKTLPRSATGYILRRQLREQ